MSKDEWKDCTEGVIDAFMIVCKYHDRETARLEKRIEELEFEKQHLLGLLELEREAHKNKILWGYGPMDAEGNYPDELQYYEPPQKRD